MICPSRCGFSVGVYAKPLIGNAVGVAKIKPIHLNPNKIMAYVNFK